MLASFPVATCWPVVDRVIAGLQAPELPPVTLLHVAVAADTGTVEQFVNEAAAVCTCKVQVLLVEPLLLLQLTVEGEFPETLPEFGFPAVKLIVAGLAETVPRAVAAGMI